MGDSQDSSPVGLIARLVALPGRRDELLQAVAGSVDAATREPLTLTYSVHADLGDDDSVWIYAVYPDWEAAEVHRNGENHEEIQARVGPLLAQPPEAHRISVTAAK